MFDTNNDKKNYIMNIISMFFCLLLGVYGKPIATRDFTTAFSTEQFVSEGTFKSNITEGTSKSNVTDGPSDPNMSKVLKTYRAVMIPIGSFISCIFAFVIIREIRLYKSAKNEDSLDKIG